jgi:predicted  nucleic acid-binding Zn-ribbon protein
VKRTMAGISVAVVSFCASAAMPASMASADQIANTRSQLHDLEQAVAAGASRIHSLTESYDQANLEAVDLAQQVAGDQTELVQLQTKVSQTRDALQREALIGYTAGTQTAVGTAGGSTSDPSIRAAYMQVAAGDITDVLDQYRAQQDAVASAESALLQQERASQRAATAVASARQEALDQATTEQSELNQLQQQLDQLVLAASIAAQQRLQTQGLPVNNGVVTVVQSIVSSGGAGGVWLQLRECESGNNYRANTGNGYYGAYQFSESTWTGLGYPGRPDIESAAMQDQAAQRLQREYGWSQWPACSAALGLD